MSASVDSDELRTNWRLIAILLLLACGLIIGAAYRVDDYSRSIMLEAATGVFLFLAIQSLLGREVDEHEQAIAYIIGFAGFITVIVASFTGAFSQSILIELGMGALLFCALDVIVVRRLKQRIENLEQRVRESYNEIEEREERERAVGKFIFGEDWEPGDMIGGFGGIYPEDHERGWE